MSRGTNEHQFAALLAEFVRAEQAGVFRPSPCDAALNELARVQPRRKIRAAAWFSAAGAVAAVVMGAVWFGPHLGHNKAVGGSAPGSGRATVLVAYRGFDRCLDGSSAMPAENCRQFDVDRDRQVNLADYASLQRQSADAAQ